MIVSKSYKEFMELWDSVAFKLVKCPDKHQKFFFDYLFRLILSLLENFEETDVQEARKIAMKFYGISFAEMEEYINSIQALTTLIKLGFDNFTSTSGTNFHISMLIDLLRETALDYEVLNSYTFDDAISLLPQELKYPPELALKILNDMGYSSVG